MKLLRYLKRRRFEKRFTISLDDTYVVTALIEPRKKDMYDRAGLTFYFKKYYICKKVKEQYQHIRSKKEIKIGLKEKYYEIVDFEKIEKLSDYVENDELLELQKNNSRITIREILELEDTLDLLANR